MRRTFVLLLLLVVLIAGWLRWRGVSSPARLGEWPAPTVNKQPVHYASRTFDPAAPPPDMPPLRTGENAQCDSNFVSDAKVTGQTQQIDAAHGTVTLSRILVTLNLNITVWAPIGATQTVIDHEEGHRQISEYYYQNADKLAERIAATYLGKQIEIAGADLNAESDNELQKVAAEIAAEYGRGLNTEPTQLLYDAITDHSRNGVIAKDAVDHALKNVSVEFAQPAASEQSDPR